MRRTPTAVAIVAIAVAACGGAETQETTAAAPETTAAQATLETSPPTTTADTSLPETTPASHGGAYAVPDTAPADDAAAGNAALAVADTELGEILVDADGMTLYVFLPDAQGASTCYDDCAANWPPFVGEPTAAEGIDEALLGTTERDDGEIQVTYNGWPLYYFAADSAPGDLNGQGVGENWFVVDPSGEVVEG